MTWRVRRSWHVHKDRWVSLRADDCLTSAGVEITPYYVLEYPDFVHAVVIDTADHVVLVRQYRHGFGGASLELPGGVMDAADAGPAGTAAREAREETGYAGPSPRLVGTLSIDPARIANRLHAVLIEHAVQVAAPEPEETEQIEIVRMPVQEAVRAALTGRIVNAAHVGMLLIGLEAAGRIGVAPRP